MGGGIKGRERFGRVKLTPIIFPPLCPSPFFPPSLSLSQFFSLLTLSRRGNEKKRENK